MNEIKEFMTTYKKEINEIAKLVPELLDGNSTFSNRQEGMYINDERMVTYSSYEFITIWELSNGFCAAVAKEKGFTECPCMIYKVKHKCSGTPCSMCAMHTFYQIFYKGRRIKVL